MPLRVLIIPDKFKGTLTAAQAAEAMARGWRSARPHDTLELLPMSDGGDGFGAIIGEMLGAQLQTVKTLDAAHRPIEVHWWWDEASRTAVIESALVIGLSMLPHGRFHPFELDTRGLGTVLQKAAAHGARHCVVGIGGSATNDGGFGMARTLGWQFFNAHEESITRWSELYSLAVIRPPDPIGLFDDLVVAVDVQNPLLGPTGCSRIYGPQKGLSEFDFAERCLGQLARVLEQELHIHHASEPGAGAAGGLGFGLRSFANARLEAGFDRFAKVAGLEERLKKAQVVITGEGAVDASTLMGKGVGEVASLCRRLDVPCIGLAGMLNDAEVVRAKLSAAHALTPELTTPDQAMRDAALWLERLAAKVAAGWNSPPLPS